MKVTGLYYSKRQGNIAHVINDSATPYVSASTTLEKHKKILWVLCIPHYINKMLKDIGDLLVYGDNHTLSLLGV